MRVDDDNSFKIYLKARDVAERALVAAHTSPRDAMYQERIGWAREALTALLAVIDVEDKPEGIDG